MLTPNKPFCQLSFSLVNNEYCRKTLFTTCIFMLLST